MAHSYSSLEEVILLPSFLSLFIFSAVIRILCCLLSLSVCNGLMIIYIYIYIFFFHLLNDFSWIPLFVREWIVIFWGLILSMTSNSVFKQIIWLEICFIFGSFIYTLSKMSLFYFILFFILFYYNLMFSHVYSHQNDVLNLKILNDFF